MAERRIFFLGALGLGSGRGFVFPCVGVPVAPLVGSIFAKWSNSAQTTETLHVSPVWAVSAGFLFAASCLCLCPGPPQTFVNRREWPHWESAQVVIVAENCIARMGTFANCRTNGAEIARSIQSRVSSAHLICILHDLRFCWAPDHISPAFADKSEGHPPSRCGPRVSRSAVIWTFQ